MHERAVDPILKFRFISRMFKMKGYKIIMCCNMHGGSLGDLRILMIVVIIGLLIHINQKAFNVELFN